MKQALCKNATSDYETLLKTSPDAVTATDLQGRITTVSRHTLQLHGYKNAKELIGKSAFKLIAPQDRKRAIESLKQTLKEGTVRNLEYRMLKKDGTSFIGGLNASLLRDENGRPAGFIATVRDLTHLKRIEEELRHERDKVKKYVDVAQVMLLALDGKGNVRLANRKACEIVGYPENEIVGRNWFDNFVPKKYANGVKAVFEKIMKGKIRLVEYYENPVKTKGGEKLIAWHNAYLRDDSGKITGTLSSGLDITESRKGEEALRKSEEKYRTLAEQTNDIIYLLNPAGNVTYVSPAVANYGFKPKDLLGKSMLSLIVLQDRPRMLYNFLKTLRTGKEFISEFRVKDARGNILRVENNSKIVRDEEGKTIGMTGILRDITERRKAEADLRKEQEEQQTMLNSVPAWIFFKDKENRFVRVNRAFAETMGMTIEQLDGKSLFDLYPRKEAEAFWKDDKEVMASGKPKRNIIEPLQVRNETRWAQTDKIPYRDAQGTVVGIIGFAIDITERKKAEQALKESEEKYSKVVESANDAIFIVQDAVFKFANTASTKITGYPMDEFIGTPFLNIVAPEYRETVAKRHGARIKGKKVISTYEIEFITKKGERKPAEISSALTTYQGKPAVLVTARDTSERKKAEETIKNYTVSLEAEVERRTRELREEKDKVEKLAEVKDRFITDIGHELKTPLSVIMGNIGLLKDIAPMGKAKEWSQLLDMLDRNADRLSASINQIMQLRKIGTTEIRSERVYVKDLLKDVYDEYAPLAEIKKLDFKVEAEPVVIIGDGELLRLVFSNLVSNAIKFTEKGSVNVKARPWNEHITVTVSDTGKGISPADQKKLSIKFFKANPAAPGTGIGLTIAKEIVEKHKGKITLQSKPGKGSVFEVVLPRGVEK